MIYGPGGEPISAVGASESHSRPRSSGPSPGPEGAPLDFSYRGEELAGDIVIYRVGDFWRAYDRFGGLIAETPTRELLNRRIYAYRVEVAKEHHRLELIERGREEHARRRWPRPGG